MLGPELLPQRNAPLVHSHDWWRWINFWLKLKSGLSFNKYFLIIWRHPIKWTSEVSQLNFLTLVVDLWGFSTQHQMKGVVDFWLLPCFSLTMLHPMVFNATSLYNSYNTLSWSNISLKANASFLNNDRDCMSYSRRVWLLFLFLAISWYCSSRNYGICSYFLFCKNKPSEISAEKY